VQGAGTAGLYYRFCKKMKTMKHKALLSSTAIGIPVMSSIVLQCATVRADTGGAQLRTWLHENKVVSRLVKLDREYGFTYGLSITGPGLPNMLIAPGRQRMWLLNIDDSHETILQPDARGGMRVIAQTVDYWVCLCYIKKITSFFIAAKSCTTALCFTDQILTLLIGFNTFTPVGS